MPHHTQGAGRASSHGVVGARGLPASLTSTMEAARPRAGFGNLSSIVDHLLVGLAEVDLRGRVLAANERFCRFAGAASEARALEMGRILHAQDVPTFQRAIARLAAGGDAFVQEARLAATDGRLSWVEISASPLADERGVRSAALVMKNITRHKEVEARAIESQRRFLQVADAAPVFIWTSGTDRQRRHTWVNARWTNFRGRPVEAELGSGWTQGVHPDDLAGCLAAYCSAFDRRSAFTSEYRLRRHDGEYGWRLDSGAPMHDDAGRFIGYVGSSIDISDRKAEERERERLLAAERAARSDAERANRLKEEFLSILSHELRTPLNAVLGWVHLLRTSMHSDEQLDRGLNVIERNARMQSRMVDDLLDMGGVIAGKMRLERRRVPIARVVIGAAESLQPAFIEKGVTLRRPTETDVGEVDGDPSRLHQIVWNLLSNALKFTPAGGRVEIELHRCNPEVRIIVRDNGPGIDAAFLPFVFERFRQGDPSTRRSHGGLGIGLALVKSLTELHGGCVAASSDGLGCGATFVVSLPLSSGPGAEPPRPEVAYGTPLEGSYGS